MFDTRITIQMGKNIQFNEIKPHARVDKTQCCWFEFDKKTYGRSVVPCDNFDKRLFKQDELPPSQAYFRLLSSISDQRAIVKIDCITGKFYFLQDYDSEDYIWDRGHRSKLIVTDLAVFKEQFRIFNN